MAGKGESSAGIAPDCPARKAVARGGGPTLGAADAPDHCFPSSASCPPSPPSNWGGRGNMLGSMSEEGWGQRPLHPCQLPATALAGWAVYCDELRSLLCLSPLARGRKVAALLPGSGCLAEVRSGVSRGGQVQQVLRWFTGQGRVGAESPHCGCQVSQDGASFLEKGSQAWADPLVLGSNS